MRAKHITWVLVIVMTLTPSLQLAAQQPTQPVKKVDYAKLKEHAERHFRAAAEVRGRINRETFDPQVILDREGRSPEKLFVWVRDNTYLAPYVGLLRGHRGVLMDRVGNSLDRALLLGELLRRAGFQVRFANAPLSDAEAKKILASARPYPAEGWRESKLLEREELKEQLKALEAVHGVNSADLLARIEAQKVQFDSKAETAVQRVVEQAPRLSQLIDGVRRPVNATEVEQQRVQSIRSHWWVQFRRDDKWIDCDPTLPAANVGDSITTAQQTTETAKSRRIEDTLASSLKHTLQLRVVVERWENGRLVVSPVLEQSFEPFRLSGEPIVLTHVPLDWPFDNKWVDPKKPLESLKKQIAKQWEWFPVLLVGDKMVVNSSFTTSGRVNANAKASITAPPTRNALNKLTDALGDQLVNRIRSKPAKRPAEDRLTAEWVEFVIQRPGHPERVVRRPIFDLIGPAARSKRGGAVAEPQLTEIKQLRRGLSVIGMTEILPLCCSLSTEYVQQVATLRAAANRDPMLAALAPNAKQRVFRSTPMPGKLYELAIARQAWNLHRHEVYLNQLNVFTRRTVIMIDEQGKLTGGRGFDLIANELAQHRSSETDPFELKLEQGVADTVLEAVLIGDSKSKVINTSELFESTRADPTKWTTIRRSDEPALQRLQLSPNTRTRIEDDLRRGYVVVVHDTGGANEEQAVAWWRINPETGDTLGMMGSSRGEGHAEYVIITCLIMICPIVVVFAVLSRTVEDLSDDWEICRHVGDEEPTLDPDGDADVPTLDDDAPEADERSPRERRRANRVAMITETVEGVAKALSGNPLFWEYTFGN